MRSAYALKDETHSTPFHSVQGDTLIFSATCVEQPPAGADLPFRATVGRPHLSICLRLLCLVC